jgi:hypothetical protein
MIEKFIFIKASFLNEHAIRLTWAQLLWGLDKAFISAKEISIYALQIVEKSDVNDPDVILLAGLTKDELFKVRELLEKISIAEGYQDTNETEKKWLYIILLWLYENRDKLDDPLGKVEIVYADFNYPISMSSFVRYMPSEVEIQSSEMGESFLFQQWKQFLEHSTFT